VEKSQARRQLALPLLITRLATRLCHLQLRHTLAKALLLIA